MKTGAIKKCDCINVKVGSYGNQQIFRDRDGHLIGIDRCLIFEITYLWQLGVRTIASCCGHGETKATIIVDKLSESIMEKLGYKGEINPFGVLVFFSDLPKASDFRTPMEVGYEGS